MDGPAVAAVIPCWDGQMGILHMRAPLVARLGIGELRLDFPDTPQTKGGSRSYLVEGGFAHMLNNKLTILAERATPTESISESEAQSGLAAAEQRAASATTPAQHEQARKDRDKAAKKLHIVRAFKARGGGI